MNTSRYQPTQLQVNRCLNCSGQVTMEVFVDRNGTSNHIWVCTECGTEYFDSPIQRGFDKTDQPEDVFKGLFVASLLSLLFYIVIFSTIKGIRHFLI